MRSLAIPTACLILAGVVSAQQNPVPSPDPRTQSCTAPLMWANVPAGESADPSKGGWRIGGGTRENYAAMVGVGFSPYCTASVAKLEIVAAKESGNDPLVAYIMGDNGSSNGPGAILDVFYFSPGNSAAVLQANSTLHNTLFGGQGYWVVLTTPNERADSFFWSRGPQQPAGPIAYRAHSSDPWKVYQAYTAMIRIEADTTTPPMARPNPAGNLPPGVYAVGNGVTPPRAIYAPDPEYSEAARKQKFQGIVVVSAVVGADGAVRDVKVYRSLRPDLDEKAMDAVRRWRFEPGTKDGQAVPVAVSIEVNFRLR